MIATGTAQGARVSREGSQDAHLVKREARKQVQAEAYQRYVRGRVIHIRREVSDDFVGLLEPAGTAWHNMEVASRHPVQVRCVGIGNPLDCHLDLRGGMRGE